MLTIWKCVKSPQLKKPHPLRADMDQQQNKKNTLTTLQEETQQLSVFRHNRTLFTVMQQTSDSVLQDIRCRWKVMCANKYIYGFVYMCMFVCDCGRQKVVSLNANQSFQTRAYAKATQTNTCLPTHTNTNRPLSFHYFNAAASVEIRPPVT